MRHKLKGRKLNRTSSHRKALLNNLACALLKHGLIKTTLPKAKELRPFVEKLITISKVDSLVNRRTILSVIKDKELVTKLFSNIAVNVKSRNGGYTRIMHYGFRSGDKAPMAIIELVDRNIQNQQPENKKTSSYPKKSSSKLEVRKVENNDSTISKEPKISKSKKVNIKNDE